MTIGLDYDQTYTADPGLWDAFIALAKSRGHEVVCVTSRQQTEENAAECDIKGVFTYMTSGSAKSWYMEQHGVKVDVWIDDSPEAVWSGR